ncbi:MAG: GNAT family N-acetyltransferase [Rhizobiales bacterium]|nr:GNAT family N-acetyltransferase [Hyphomicrobiales bacterium]
MFRIEKLARDHATGAFDCGSEPLNRFLSKHALSSQQANASQTYVGVKDGGIVGFHTLVAGEVGFDAATERLKKGLVRHPVPVMVLARLAVDRRWSGIGAGRGLLKDAALRALNASSIVGARALVVHAKDEGAGRFYLHFGFADGFDDPMHLYMLMKDLRAFAGQ